MANLLLYILSLMLNFVSKNAVPVLLFGIILLAIGINASFGKKIDTETKSGLEHPFSGIGFVVILFTVLAVMGIGSSP